MRGERREGKVGVGFLKLIRGCTIYKKIKKTKNKKPQPSHMQTIPRCIGDKLPVPRDKANEIKPLWSAHL